jgi:dihydropteroate synthase
VKDTLFYNKLTLNLRGNIQILDRPHLMGIVNLSRDSFFPGSRTSLKNILNTAEKMIEDGADFLDIGGFSSRPGFENIPLKEELNRCIPAIIQLHQHFPSIPLSIDTWRAEVAAEAIQAGAAMVNDISAGMADPAMFKTIAAFNVPYVIMHSNGDMDHLHTPMETEDIMGDLIHFFSSRIFELTHNGVNDIIIDPGFGFSKTLEQNYHVLNHLDDLSILRLPIFIGVSRKSMVFKVIKSNPEKALNGSSAINTIAVLKGASILRVHDVKEAKEVVDLVRFMNTHN